MPLDIPVHTAAPKIEMPSEAIDRLAADTALARTQPELGFAVGSWRSAQAAAYAMIAAARKGPGPAWWSSCLCGEGAGKAVRSYRMGAPIGIDRQPGQRRDERAAKCVNQHRLRKYLWQSPFEALDGSAVLFNAPIGTRHDPPLSFVRTEIIEQVGKRFMDAGLRGTLRAAGVAQVCSVEQYRSQS